MLLKSKRFLSIAGLALTLFAGAVWAFGPPVLSPEGVEVVANHAAHVSAVPPDGVAPTPGAENFTEVEFMSRAVYHADTQYADRKAFGGFGRSDNKARRVSWGARPEGLYLIAQPEVVESFGDKQGMRVVIVNGTDDVLRFTACDSMLSLVQEAQRDDGSWAPIEYRPRSWCGNSYHRVFLAPNYYWKFFAPRYRGPVPTKLRFTMVLSDGTALHSNEFDGSIHPKQFTDKEGHQARHIMDPYNE